MPYTQANPLSEEAQNAVDRKVYLLKKRAQDGGSEEATYYFNARTPWIRMSSGVDIVGSTKKIEFGVSGQPDDQLARNFQLTTVSETTNLPAGHKNTSLGIRPQPGIENMDVVSHNQFGSLRTATVNFKVWSKEDLDACETLYMRPGMSVLLEWGWSLYLEGEGENIRVEEMGLGLKDEIFDIKNKTLLQVLKKIGDLQKQYGYGYDAIFGFTKNFSWSLRPDGGYDCSVNIVSPGELVESLNVAYPPTDIDVASYQSYFSKLLATKLEEAQGSRDKAIKEVDPILFGIFGGGAADPMERAKNNTYKLFEEIQAFSSKIPDFKTQTALSTFFNFDIMYFAFNKFTEFVKEKKGLTLCKLGLDGIDQQSRYANRVVAKYPNSRFHDILGVNWINPEYEKTKDGKLALQDGEEIVIPEYTPQLYIKYGLLIEVFNSFMLQSGANAITPISTESPATFNDMQGTAMSLNPGVCILPQDFAVLQKNRPVNKLTFTDNTSELSSSIIARKPERPTLNQAALDSSLLSELSSFANISEADTASNNILDIFVSVDLIRSLLETSGLKRISSNGVQLIKLYDFIEQVNSQINQACAGMFELSLQYFEHEGQFALIDRRSFDDNAGNPTQLDILGLGSMFHGISLSSKLTPELSSAIAISAQTKVRSGDSSTASFLKFNEGIRDRVVQDRKLVGSFVKEEEDKYNSPLSDDPEESIAQIYQIYTLVYGLGNWLPASWTAAREKLHQYNNERFGNSEDGNVAGRVVIPFISQLTIDGMSGFNILNGFKIDSNLLPYTYDTISGGVGLVITGISTRVDSSKWVSVLNSQFYSLDAGTIEPDQIRTAVVKQVSNTVEEDNIIIEYANQLMEEQNQNSIRDYVTNSTGTSGVIVSNLREVGDVDLMVSTIKRHYADLWDSGNRKEDEEKFQPDSALKLYFDNANIPVESWINELSGKYPWSAVYVSFMMNRALDTWKTSTAHWSYAHDALQNRFQKKKGTWVLFTLYDDQKWISVQEGDVLLKPRAGSRYNSHGDIVWKVDYKEKLAYLAGGNLSDTNKINNTIQVRMSGNRLYYDLPSSTSDYLLVIKKM